MSSRRPFLCPTHSAPPSLDVFAHTVYVLCIHTYVRCTSARSCASSARHINRARLPTRRGGLRSSRLRSRLTPSFTIKNNMEPRLFPCTSRTCRATFVAAVPLAQSPPPPRTRHCSKTVQHADPDHQIFDSQIFKNTKSPAATVSYTKTLINVPTYVPI